jgi:hypothetical membrane protein
MALSNAAKAGAAIFVGAVQFGIFIIVAEIYYSAHGVLNTSGSGNTTGYVYSVSVNFVSDLGATCRTTCTIQPSAWLFDSSIALLGLLTLVGAYFFQRAFRWKPATLLLALAGIGALGVGLFPETAGILHGIFSLIAFLFSGLSAVVTSKFQKKPMSYLSIILGLATLAALSLFFVGIDLGLGVGGMERMIVYPALLWTVGFGGHLMATEDSMGW